MTANNVLEIKKELLGEGKYFYGPQEVLRVYKQKYPNNKIPSIDFVKRICRQNDFSKKIIKRQKGCSAYQHYPAHTINNLAESISELDFIGGKYISGRTRPVNFVSYNSLKPFKFREFAVVLSQTSKEVLNFLEELWNRTPSPEILKIDNDAAFIGSFSAKRSLSKFIMFLLNYSVSPLFVSPRSPWNIGSTEGGNSIFGSKFWNKNIFTSVEDIKNKLSKFNQAYNEYLGFLNNISIERASKTAKQIYFVRKVLENKNLGYIDITNERIKLPEEYINQFVFVEWNLEKQLLKIQYENDRKLTLIEELEFKIN